VLDRKPERKGSSIISTTMWKMILGQAVYQLAITFVLYFVSPQQLPALHEATTAQIQTLVFNTFVWMQIFNQWNNRRLDNKFNIFEGLTRNWFFIGISVIMCGGQVLIVMVGGRPFNIAEEGQTAAMWAYAMILGVISIPAGMLIRLIPDTFVEKLVPAFLKKRAQSKIPGVTISDDEERFSYYPTAITDVRDELAFLKRMKGGRLNNLKFAMKHPKDAFMAMKSPSHSREHSRSNSIHRVRPQTPTREDSFGSQSAAPPTPDSRKRSRSMRSRSNSALGAATVMSGIVAGSIAATWSPVDRRGEPDFGQFPKPTPSSQGSQSDAPAAPRAHSPVLKEKAMTDEPRDMSTEPGPSATQAVPILSMPKPPKSPALDTAPRSPAFESPEASSQP
jgi:Ca2+-transporting ATPase